MNIRIQQMIRAKTDTWDRIWQNCNYATYFHSPEWAEIWASYTKGKIRPDPVLFTFSDGRTALIPLSAERGRFGMLKTYFSSPAGTFGGWISEDDLRSDQAELLLEFMTTRTGTVVWRLNPYDPLSHHLALHTAMDDETHAIDLLCGFDDIFRTWSKGHRSAVSKALREGVSVRLASSQADWQAADRSEIIAPQALAVLLRAVFRMPLDGRVDDRDRVIHSDRADGIGRDHVIGNVRRVFIKRDPFEGR